MTTHQRYMAAGKCGRCGQDRHPTSRALCRRCLETIRIAQRRFTGCRPHVETGRGRPPLTEDPT